MKDNAIIITVFFIGCLIGWSGIAPETIKESNPAIYILYALMFQVGISIGSDKNLKNMVKSLRLKMLLLPLSTILGTLLFSALISLVLTRWSVFDCLAVGSGFGYYSLSSVLIADLKSATLGVQGAAELATVALLANVVREMIALFGMPLFARWGGPLAPISVAGVTSMDVCLPSIARYSGSDLVPLAILHGIVLEVCVPILVGAFC